MNPIEIIPAILPRDFAEVEEKVALVKGFVKTVQVDVCDGHFVNSFSWPYKKKDNSFELMIREDQALPYWEDVDYEFDLMVDYPEKVVDDWVSVGAKRIIIHAEAKGDPIKAVEMLYGRVEVGLAFNIDTDVTSYLFKMNASGFKVDFIQLMGIDRIGFQGQKFDAKVIERIKDVRTAYPDLPISIDGGVSLETAAELIDAGANRLIVGSAIFESDNVVEAIQEFESL